MFTCTRKQTVTACCSIRNNTVVCRQKFLLLQLRSKPEHQYCMCDFGNRFSLERRSKLLFREENFFLAFLSKKVKKKNIYIYIKHRYKKVSSTSCVWQHLLHREVPLIPRCKDQAHSVVSQSIRNDESSIFYAGLSSGRITPSFLHSYQETTMRRLQLRWSTSSSSTIHAGNSGRHQLG